MGPLQLSHIYQCSYASCIMGQNLCTQQHTHVYMYVTGFDKTRLPHTSNSLPLNYCNLITQHAIALEHTFLSYNCEIAGPNMKLIVYIYNELCSFKVIKLDVCLVLSNPVTYVVLAYKPFPCRLHFQVIAM